MGMFFAGVGATVGLILLWGLIGVIQERLEEKHYKQQRIDEVIGIITDNSAMFTRRHLLKIVMLELHQDQYYLKSLKKMLEEVEQDAPKLP